MALTYVRETYSFVPDLKYTQSVPLNDASKRLNSCRFAMTDLESLMNLLAGRIFSSSYNFSFSLNEPAEVTAITLFFSVWKKWSGR